MSEQKTYARRLPEPRSTEHSSSHVTLAQSSHFQDLFFNAHILSLVATSGATSGPFFCYLVDYALLIQQPRDGVVAAINPSPCHELTMGNHGLPSSNIQDELFIAYGELTGVASDWVDAAVIVVISGEKDMSNGAFGDVKPALNS